MDTRDIIFVLVMAVMALSETWFRSIVAALLAAILISIWAQGEATKEDS